MSRQLVPETRTEPNGPFPACPCEGDVSATSARRDRVAVDIWYVAGSWAGCYASGGTTSGHPPPVRGPALDVMALAHAGGGSSTKVSGRRVLIARSRRRPIPGV